MDDNNTFHYLFSNYAPFMYAILNNEKKKGTIPEHIDIGDLVAGDDKGYSPVVHGLLRAVHTYDPKLGSSLESHIYRTVLGKVRDHIKSRDVPQHDVKAAAKYAKMNPEAAATAESRAVTVKPSSSSRMATESLGITGGDEGGLQYGIERNTPKQFAEQNRDFVDKHIRRKVESYENKQKAKEAAVEAPAIAPATSQPVEQPVTPPKPKMEIRRKSIEASLSPEQKDRMNRVDSQKAIKKENV